jgi:Acetyl-CoA acetyltransferase
MTGQCSKSSPAKPVAGPIQELCHGRRHRHRWCDTHAGRLVQRSICELAGARTWPGGDQGALERAGIEGKRVSEVIMGQILSAGEGQNPARQASIGAGIPVESPAWGVNQLCGSGLRAVALGYQAILNGDSDIVVAGGQESMSMAPHCAHLRGGVKMGNFEMVDTMIKDGLWDAF